MRNQLFLNILILCTAVFQGIWALSEEKKQLSDILVRKKRVINQSHSAYVVQSIERFPYIVNILRNGMSYCGGAILESNIIITAAYCFAEVHKRYSVLSGSVERERGRVHTIEQRIIHPHYNYITLENNLALLQISPPINLTQNSNRKIELHRGPLLPRSLATLGGWGCISQTVNRTVFPTLLHSIQVPIISPRQCREIYRGHDQISNTEICTYDPLGHKRSCFGDVGGPLVQDNELLGILSWSRVIPRLNTPDVYVNLLLDGYRQWIHSFKEEHRVRL